MKFQRVPEPDFRQRRVIEKFLLFPLTLNNETRFLEKARIIQEFDGVGWVKVGWKDRGGAKIKIFRTKFMIEVPKKGEEFRVGPTVGPCIFRGFGFVVMGRK